jgi:hypothetical protein
VAELDREIHLLADMAELARLGRYASTDRKWQELRAILQDGELTQDEHGHMRKIIVLTGTEHPRLPAGTDPNAARPGRGGGHPR